MMESKIKHSSYSLAVVFLAYCNMTGRNAESRIESDVFAIKVCRDLGIYTPSCLTDVRDGQRQMESDMSMNKDREMSKDDQEFIRISMARLRHVFDNEQAMALTIARSRPSGEVVV